MSKPQTNDFVKDGNTLTLTILATLLVALSHSMTVSADDALYPQAAYVFNQVEKSAETFDAISLNINTSSELSTFTAQQNLAYDWLHS